MNVMFKFPLIIGIVALMIIAGISWVEVFIYHPLALVPAITGTVSIIYLLYFIGLIEMERTKNFDTWIKRRSIKERIMFVNVTTGLMVVMLLAMLWASNYPDTIFPDMNQYESRLIYLMVGFMLGVVMISYIESMKILWRKKKVMNI